MPIVLINSELDEEELALANWLLSEVNEFRDIQVYNQDPQLLAFISTYDLGDLKEKLEACDSDYFTDGTMKLEYNGDDLVFDILPMLRRFKIDELWFKHRDDE